MTVMASSVAEGLFYFSSQQLFTLFTQGHLESNGDNRPSLPLATGKMCAVRRTLNQTELDVCTTTILKVKGKSGSISWQLTYSVSKENTCSSESEREHR